MRRRIVILIIIISISILSTINLSADINQDDKYINVEVRGEVENEDVYKVKLGTKVDDVLKLASPSIDSDISQIALNETLFNNQLIVIPEKKENHLISINTASKDDLIQIKGIGDAIANRIIEYRTNIGCFNSIQELMNVKGIGEKKFNQIKEYICL